MTVYDTTALGLGQHTVVANYSGDAVFEPMTATLTQLVTSRTTTTVTASPSSISVYGQPVTFTAKVTSASGNPTGVVQFYVDDSPVPGGPVDLVGGTAALVLNNLAVGSHRVTALYGGGDTSFGPSTGSAPNQTVNQDPTKTSVEISAPGGVLTFKAKVVPTYPGAVPATGTVLFTINGVLVPSSPANPNPAPLGANGEATLTLANLTGTNNFVKAVYSGDTNYGLSQSGLTPIVFVNSKTTLTSSAASPSPIGQPVTITATVTSPGTAPSGWVTFSLDGDKQLAPVPQPGSPPDQFSVAVINGKASITFNNLAVNAAGYNITAVFISTNSNVIASTASLVQKVAPAATKTTVTSDHSQGAVTGTAVKFTATVSAAPSALAATGSVVFKINGAPVSGQLAVSGGQAFITIANLATGRYAVTAVYTSNNTNIAGSTSQVFTQAIGRATTTTLTAAITGGVALTSGVGVRPFGRSVTFRAVVRPTTGAGIPQGTVTYFVNGVARATVALNVNGVAPLTLRNVPAGANVIRAVYNRSPVGQPVFIGSNSNNFTLNVRAVATTISSIAVTFPTGNAPANITAKVAAPETNFPVYGKVVFYLTPLNAAGQPTGARVELGTVVFTGGTATLTNVFQLGPIGSSERIEADFLPTDANFLGSVLAVKHTNRILNGRRQ